MCSCVTIWIALPGGLVPSGSREAVVDITAELARKFEVVPLLLRQATP